MRVPGANLASISQQKVADYLLDPSHPVGGSKAAFFVKFGFERLRWRELAEALLSHVLNNDVVDAKETKHGHRFVVDGPLRSPSGLILNVRSAWFIDNGLNVPRFVTAHPLPRK